MATILGISKAIFFACLLTISSAFFTRPEKLVSTFLNNLLMGESKFDFSGTSLKESPRPNKLRGENFGYRDCGGSKMSFEYFDMKPDPLVASTKANISLAFTALETLEGRIDLNLTIYRKARGKLSRVPCIANMGSCMYHNICSKLKMRSNCADPIIEAGSNCKCPINARSYDIKKFRRKIPGNIVSGQYVINLRFLEKEEQIGCLEFDLAVIHKT